MPGKAGTLYAHWKLADAGKDLQTPEIVWLGLFIKFTRNHLVELAEERFRLGLCLALDRYGHHARGCFGNSAARSFQADVFQSSVLQRRIHGELIAAERIVTCGSVVRRFQLMKVTRFLVMVEDDLLIELA